MGKSRGVVSKLPIFLWDSHVLGSPSCHDAGNGFLLCTVYLVLIGLKYYLLFKCKRFLSSALQESSWSPSSPSATVRYLNESQVDAGHIPQKP